jgi:hypothetical protein
METMMLVLDLEGSIVGSAVVVIVVPFCELGGLAALLSFEEGVIRGTGQGSVVDMFV